MWADKIAARRHWPDAVNIDDTTLDELLAAAFESVEPFAPALAEGETVPTRYVLGHILQAREVRRASIADAQDVIGVGDYAIRARPLTGPVKQLLRPQRGRPGIG